MKVNVETESELEPEVDHAIAETPAGDDVATRAGRRRPTVPMIIGAGVVLVLATGGLMAWRAASKVNNVALDALPQPVSVVPARAASYRPSRAYVGTLRPWVQANVGPQFIAAYVDSVLVRPGAVVKRGDVLATLDCRDASASAQAIKHQARAIAARQQALADEAARTQQLLSGGFVSQNQAEKTLATSTAEEAQLEAQKANLAKISLSVGDCVLRAPFASEVSIRYADPGAFVRPGMPIVTVVDRGTVRMTADAPESDFDVVAPGNPVHVHVISTGQNIPSTITRRAPAADPGTRTVHFEIDIPDPNRQVPVNTTGEVYVDVGQPVTATEVPIYAASVQGEKATVFTADKGVARSVTVPILGESGGSLFFSPAELKPGTPVVVEGQALLHQGDRVAAREMALPTSGSAATVVAAPAGKRVDP